MHQRIIVLGEALEEANGNRLAASAGQFLLSAGTPGKRYALPHSRVLLHQGSAGIAGRPSTSRSRPTTCG